LQIKFKICYVKISEEFSEIKDKDVEKQSIHLKLSYIKKVKFQNISSEFQQITKFKYINFLYYLN